MKFYLNTLLEQHMARLLEESDREDAKRRHPSSQTNTEESK